MDSLENILNNEDVKKVLDDRIREYLISSGGGAETFDLDDIESKKEWLNEIIGKILEEELENSEQIFENVPLQEIRENINAIGGYLYRKDWPDQETRQQIKEKLRKLKIVRINSKKCKTKFLSIIFSTLHGGETANGAYFQIFHQIVIPDKKINKPSNEEDEGVAELKKIFKDIDDRLAKKGIDRTLIHELYHSICVNDFWKHDPDDEESNGTPYYSTRRSGIRTERANGIEALEHLDEAVTECLTILTINKVLKGELPFIEFMGRKFTLQQFLLRMNVFSYSAETIVMCDLIKKVPFEHFRIAYFERKKLTSLSKLMVEKFGISLSRLDNLMEEDYQSNDFQKYHMYKKTLKVLRG